MNINNYGFILTRHVNSENTNKYWNRCIRCIRTFYPLKKIVVIDDNSKKEFVKAEFEYKNVIFIESEFPGRGELLPYYYFYKHKFFDNAVIIHDSVFFHQRINFDNIRKNIIPLWHFNSDKENVDNTIHLVNSLNGSNEIINELNNKDLINLGLHKNKKWYGCFGCQCYINYTFLSELQDKYQLFNLLNVIKNRSDRCCLERILGVIFFLNSKNLYKNKSLLGNIMTYCVWGFSYNDYNNFLESKKGAPLPLVKVWTGR